MYREIVHRIVSKLTRQITALILLLAIFCAIYSLIHVPSVELVVCSREKYIVEPIRDEGNIILLVRNAKTHMLTKNKHLLSRIYATLFSIYVAKSLKEINSFSNIIQLLCSVVGKDAFNLKVNLKELLLVVSYNMHAYVNSLLEKRSEQEAKRFWGRIILIIIVESTKIKLGTKGIILATTCLLAFSFDKLGYVVDANFIGTMYNKIKDHLSVKDFLTYSEEAIGDIVFNFIVNTYGMQEAEKTLKYLSQ